MNTNFTNTKIDSETFVCMICLAAFIGYTLGLRNAVKDAVKIQQRHKATQTNLSELAEILTARHLMVENNANKNSTMTITATQLPTPATTTAENNTVDSIETSVSSDNHINNEMTTSSNTLNNSEEEYEVILGNDKKNYITKVTMTNKFNYFSWFDSIF